MVPHHHFTNGDKEKEFIRGLGPWCLDVPFREQPPEPPRAFLQQQWRFCGAEAGGCLPVGRCAGGLRCAGWSRDQISSLDRKEWGPTTERGSRNGTLSS